MEQFFLFLSFMMIFSSIMTMTSINPIHSVFWLVMVFINSAGLLISLKFEFMSLMLMMIYVGAMAILFLFVMMMLDILQLSKIEFMNHMIPIVIMMGINVITQSWWLLENNNLFFSWSSLIKDWDFELLTHMTNLGLLLYTEYAYPFMILSMLLLVAMVGAMVLTLELGQMTSSQSLSDQHHSNNSWI